MSSKAALSYRCSWYMNQLIPVMKDPWGYLPVPKGPDGKRRSWITSDAMVMAIDSKAKDAAFKVMQFGSSPEMETIYMEFGLLQPSRQSLIPKWLGFVKAATEKSAPQSLKGEFDEWIKAYDYSPTSQPHFSDHALAMDVLQPVWDQVFKTGTAKVKDVIPPAVKEINAKLKDIPSTIVR